MEPADVLITFPLFIQLPDQEIQDCSEDGYIFYKNKWCPIKHEEMIREKTFDEQTISNLGAN